eukprot:14319803-Ditylum_brightwellii.AAC.1
MALETPDKTSKPDKKEGDILGGNKALKLFHVCTCSRVHYFKGQMFPCPYEEMTAADRNKRAKKDFKEDYLEDAKPRLC